MTDKAARILQKMQKRQALKRWKPYDGPADWNFIVLSAPKRELEEGGDEKPEVSSG